MTKAELIKELDSYPDDMEVNFHREGDVHFENVKSIHKHIYNWSDHKSTSSIMLSNKY